MAQIRKAVFPAAGLGTRFLPATKAVPKEMLPIVDIPQIQYSVQEAVDAGIEEIVLITGRGKVAMVDHFDVSYELESHLRQRDQKDLLKIVEEIARAVRVVAIRQKAPLGLGHAIQCAKNAVGDEPFAVILSDDVIRSEVPAIRQLIESYDANGTATIAVMEVEGGEISKYGSVIPAGGESPGPRLTQLRGMVEKPPAEKAPSNLAIIGRYVLPPEIFGAIEKVKPDAKGEIQLTEALRILLGDQPIFAYEFEGKRYDAGDKLGFLQATVEFALARKDIGPAFRDYLRSLKI